MYTAGRGDSYIQMFSYDPSTLVTQLGNYNSATSQKGFAWLPKWTLDATNHEVARGARLTSDKKIEYLAFVLPSKTGQF